MSYEINKLDFSGTILSNNLSNIASMINIGDELLWMPDRLVPFEHWVGHIPFIFWLMKVAKPRRFVELGTHRGNSYCAMCQAVKYLNLNSVGIAIDTWDGDVHMAFEEGIFDELKAYHDPRYRGFSTLNRTTFDDARPYFSDGSIDLLHIDGTHTYESVRHDFELWLPTLSNHGIILFHDIEVRRDNFGVWRLWEELSARYPHFSFRHSYGLGVLSVGQEHPRFLDNLLNIEQDPDCAALVRSIFAMRGSALIDLLMRHESEKEAEKLKNILKERDLTITSLKSSAIQEGTDNTAKNIKELEIDLQQNRQNLELRTLEYERIMAGLDQQTRQHQKIISEFEAHHRRTAQQHEHRLERLKHESQQERESLQRTIDSIVANREILHRELTAILRSKSWRWTRPLREARLWLRAFRIGTQQAILSPLRWFWRRAPLSLETRARIQAQVRPPERLECSAESVEPVPLPCRKSPAVFPRPVRMIAFHLPQYHEIPENNQWWGKGFTEWTNVQRTHPLFHGHYQPHIPLQGYYDLTDPSVLPRQAELARRYGIEGFCFYFYWFRGHRLLEQPLQMLLAHPEWEIPFCLCWANENWTRRWDGLDQEILISQDYSEADDQAFIGYLERYLRDHRYIRVEGRPLLLLYRPDLLPDAATTVARWREHCRRAGIGEIFVAYTQSFERRDPRDYGMDAAVEFPPNNMAPPQLDPQDLGCAEDYAGMFYDWSVFPERATHYSAPDYPLFRGLNPGWDNTPRRKDRATILLGSNPLGYQQWAVRACEDSIARFPDQESRLIFINAWNEWGEGAHLEPDVRYGCAYLEATDMAQLRAAATARQLPRKSTRVAIVIHAYYPEVLQEILPYLEQITPNTADLWVTTTEDRSEQVEKLLTGLALRLSIRSYPNRGRDVLPFLMLLPELVAADYGYVLKLHTKKSLHRADGDAWRRAFCEILLNPENLRRNCERMEKDPTLAMLAPKDYVVPMSLFWGSNARQSLLLAKRMGITPEELNALHFVAGTMFFCRWEALLPIWALQLQPSDFEEEYGQVDGTLAHAVERAFGMACYALGYQVGRM